MATKRPLLFELVGFFVGKILIEKGQNPPIFVIIDLRIILMSVLTGGAGC